MVAGSPLSELQPPTKAALEVYTIGHSNVPLGRIVELLRECRIDIVIDVRSIPYSRNASQFNREALADELAKAGLGYRFAGTILGGRPSDPGCYIEGRLPSGKANYLAAVNYDEVAKRDWYQRGIRRVMELAGRHRVAVLCSEEDPYRCHRHHLIARSLHMLGVNAWHIRGDGTRELATFERQAESQARKSEVIRQLMLFASEDGR